MNDLNFIHRYVPASGGSISRTLLMLHGTGGNEDDLLQLGRKLDPEAALISPRGKVLENGMPRFFRRLAEGVFDEEDLVRRTHELADFIEAAERRYELAPKSVVAVGYSNGANIAAAILLLRPEVLRGGILFRAMVPIVPAALPDLQNVGVLLAAGDNDPIVPREEAERLAELFQRAGAKVTLRFERASHGLSMGDIEAATQWLK